MYKLLPSLYRFARQEHPRAWPLVLAWDIVSFAWWRGVYGPLRHNWFSLRFWWSRGDVESQYWSPRVGDLVDGCCSEPGLPAVAVSIRKDLVITSDGLRHSLRNCVSPYVPPTVDR